MQPEHSVPSRLFRRLPQIVLLSVVVCAPIIYLIWEFLKPTYEAFSVLRIEPQTPEIYGSLKTGFVATENVAPYLESQLIVIASDQVLGEVVANPLVNKFPLITKSKDPKTDLRKQIGVEIMEGAYMIRVALELPDATEAAVIVNAVVETYMRQNNAFNRGKNMSLQKSLHDSSEELGRQIKEKKGELDRLAQEGKVVLAKPVLNANALKNDADQKPQPAFSSVTEEQFIKLADIIIQCELEYFDALAELEAVKSVRERSKDEIAEEDQGVLSKEKLREREVAVEKARRKKIAQVQYLEQLKVVTKAQNDDTLNAMLLNRELSSLISRKELVTKNFTQLQFEANEENFRVVLLDPAAVPRIPVNNKLLQYTAATPVAVFLIMLGLFLWLEIKAGHRPHRDDSLPLA